MTVEERLVVLHSLQVGSDSSQLAPGFKSVGLLIIHKTSKTFTTHHV